MPHPCSHPHQVNEDPTAQLIRELQEELARLRQDIAEGRVEALQSQAGGAREPPSPKLTDRIAHEEREADALQQQIQQMMHREVFPIQACCIRTELLRTGSRRFEVYGAEGGMWSKAWFQSREP